MRILPALSRRPSAARRARRVSPLVEGLETRQVQSSLALASSYDPLATSTTTTYSHLQYTLYIGDWTDPIENPRHWSG
jgi:hypothetical protein